MDAKITMSFDAAVINKAKAFAESNNISLSRLCEFLLRKATNSNYATLDELPISDWVNMVAEGETEYITKPKMNKQLREEYYNAKK
jgi:hypothetical protein